MSLNKVLLIGHLGQDPVVRYLDNNRVVAQFSIATHEQYTDKNGERKEDTEWHNIEVWDNLAKNVDQLHLKGYLRKGSQVYVEGKIRSEIFKDKTGVEQMRKKIKGIQIQVLGSQKPSDDKPVEEKNS